MSTKQRCPVSVVVGLALAAATLVSGCADRERVPYHLSHTPVQGAPRHIFADPVGYRYADIVPPTRAGDYQPLPAGRSRIFPSISGLVTPEAPTPKAPRTPKAPLASTAAPPAALAEATARPRTDQLSPSAAVKQAVLRGARERISNMRAGEPHRDTSRSIAANQGAVISATPSAPSLPLVEVVPHVTEADESRGTTQLRR